jgi:hypothetical protein
MCAADHPECAALVSLHVTSPRAGRTSAAKTSQSERLTFLRTEHARLSAKAAHARGRGEWALAAQVAAQLATLGVAPVPAQRR